MIFFDFDGTLTDIWTRYYEVFRASADADGFSREKYIAAKRECGKDDTVAAHLGITLPSSYYQRKRELLEELSFLKLDTLLLPRETLLAFFSAHECRILTMRRREDAFYRQLELLGLAALQERCIVLNPDGGISKAELIKTAFPDGAHTVLGDSPSEWAAAALPNVTVYAVETGLSKPPKDKKQQNLSIIDSVSDYISWEGNVLL